MKSIEIDEELYQYIASKTEFIGESASSILRRLLALDSNVATSPASPVVKDEVATEPEFSSAPEQKSSIENHASVFDHINKEELAMQRGAVGRFLLILAALHRVHTNKFAAVCNIRGRDRLYFADSEKALAETGSSTKPRQIPESDFWVITNSNTGKKRSMLTQALVVMGCDKKMAKQIAEQI